MKIQQPSQQRKGTFFWMICMLSLNQNYFFKNNFGTSAGAEHLIHFQNVKSAFVYVIPKYYKSIHIYCLGTFSMWGIRTPCISKAIWTIGTIFGMIQDWWGSGGVLLTGCQIFSATCQWPLVACESCIMKKSRMITQSTYTASIAGGTSLVSGRYGQALKLDQSSNQHVKLEDITGTSCLGDFTSCTTFSMVTWIQIPSDAHSGSK